MKKIRTEQCIECQEDTSFGTGKFVNRFASDSDMVEGYICADCQSVECDRCHQKTTEYQLDGNVLCMECIAREEDDLHRIFILQTGVIS